MNKYLRIKVAEMDGRYNESSVQWLYNTYNTYNTYIYICNYTYKFIYIIDVYTIKITHILYIYIYITNIAIYFISTFIYIYIYICIYIYTYIHIYYDIRGIKILHIFSLH